MAKVEVAWTTPLVAKSVPLKVPMAKLPVVALVVWKLVDWSAEEKSVVVVALVAWKVVAKSDVEVELVVVELRPVKFWKVEEPVSWRLPKKPVPDAVKAVDDAYGKIEATVEVAVKVEAEALPCTTSAPRRSDEPATSKMLPVVVVALVPKRRTCAVLVG